MKRTKQLADQIEKAKEFFVKRDALFAEWNATFDEMLSTQDYTIYVDRSTMLNTINGKINSWEHVAVIELYNLLWALGEFEKPAAC